MCLGFDVADEVVRRVDYVEERLPWEEPTQGFMEKLLWTKFQPWSYEAEVRAFVTREEQESQRYFFHFGDRHCFWYLT